MEMVERCYAEETKNNTSRKEECCKKFMGYYINIGMHLSKTVSVHQYCRKFVRDNKVNLPFSCMYCDYVKLYVRALMSFSCTTYSCFSFFIIKETNILSIIKDILLFNSLYSKKHTVKLYFLWQMKVSNYIIIFIMLFYGRYVIIYLVCISNTHIKGTLWDYWYVIIVSDAG